MSKVAVNISEINEEIITSTNLRKHKGKENTDGNMKLSKEWEGLSVKLQNELYRVAYKTEHIR